MYWVEGGLRRGFASVLNKNWIKNMYWGEGRLQRGFPSILNKNSWIRNMYCCVYWGKRLQRGFLKELHQFSSQAIQTCCFLYGWVSTIHKNIQSTLFVSCVFLVADFRNHTKTYVVSVCAGFWGKLLVAPPPIRATPFEGLDLISNSCFGRTVWNVLSWRVRFSEASKSDFIDLIDFMAWAWAWA